MAILENIAVVRRASHLKRWVIESSGEVSKIAFVGKILKKMGPSKALDEDEGPTDGKFTSRLLRRASHLKSWVIESSREVSNMPFMGKFLKKKGASQELDEDEEPADSRRAAESGTGPMDGQSTSRFVGEEGEVQDAPEFLEDEEEEQGASRFRTTTVSLPQESDEGLDDVEEVVSGDVPAASPVADLSSLQEDEASEVNVPVASPLSGLADMDEDEQANATSELLKIFEEEVVVDHGLEAKASWVEDVDAEELVDDLRSLMEEIENL